MFEEQVERTPDAVAVVSADRQLTYRELNVRATRLALDLRRRGVRPGSLVAISVERSLGLIVGLVAVLKTGAAYLPLGPEYPAARKRALLQDARPVLILSASPLEAALAQVGIPAASLDSLPDGDAFEETDAEFPTVHALTPAYVMYTSGSTGTPKGVCVPHRAIVRLVSNTNYVQLGPAEVLLQLAPLSFDASTFEIWGSLLNGARLVMMAGRRPSLEDIGRAVAEHGVTTMFLTSPLFRAIVDRHPEALRGVRQLLVGGDVVSPAHARRILAVLPELALSNIYGPTEATTFTCAQPVTAATSMDASIPIGRPISNSTAYVLDDELRPAAFNSSGELYIGGDGLALGYLNRPGSTAAAFVPDPFSDEQGARLYRTGDRAQYLADGSLDFLGRMDRQIKVRGFRVELGEIEAQLALCPAVREAVAVAHPGPDGEKRIVAYVTPNPDHLPPADVDSHRTESRMREWREVYERVIYDGLDGSRRAAADPTFNTLGWKSSYTGLPISDDEMREQVDQTVSRILERGPASMLEIGCGTGMLLFRLAPRCRRYVATDFSTIALEYVRRHLATLDLSSAARLVHARADDLALLQEERFDAVILNSIVQHFPSADYLQVLLQRVSRLLNPEGFVFLGDLRSRALLRHFHGSVQWARGTPDLTLQRLRMLVEQKMNEERELAVDPEIFQAMDLDGLTAVHVQLKRGRHHNELTKFRYDVILQFGSTDTRRTAVESLCWGIDVRGVDEAARVVRASAPEAIAVRGVPNARLRREQRIVETLTSDWPPGTTIGDVALTSTDDDASLDPEDWWALGDESGYRVEIDWSAGETDGRYDVLLLKPGITASLRDTSNDRDARRSAWRAYANDPLAPSLSERLRSHLRERLPEYMMPAFFVVLDRLPLTSAGKVDPANLPLPEQLTRASGPGVSSSTPTVQKLAALWQQVLGIRTIDAHESFFDLGGNSLAAIELVSLIQETCGVELSPVAVFEAPTLDRLAQLVDAGAAGGSWSDAARASLARGARRRGTMKSRASGGGRGGEQP